MTWSNFYVNTRRACLERRNNTRFRHFRSTIYRPCTFYQRVPRRRQMKLSDAWRWIGDRQPQHKNHKRWRNQMESRRGRFLTCTWNKNENVSENGPWHVLNNEKNVLRWLLPLMQNVWLVLISQTKYELTDHKAVGPPQMSYASLWKRCGWISSLMDHSFWCLTHKVCLRRFSPVIWPLS
jgi:hypothetical protein